MLPRSYARLFVLALVIPLILMMLVACEPGTAGGGSAPTMRPQTKVLLTYHGHSDRATAVAWSPDDTRFVNAIEIMDVEIALVP